MKLTYEIQLDKWLEGKPTSTDTDTLVSIWEQHYEEMYKYGSNKVLDDMDAVTKMYSDFFLHIYAKIRVRVSKLIKSKNPKHHIVGCQYYDLRDEVNEYKNR